jgi:hypothetical protein
MTAAPACWSARTTAQEPTSGAAEGCLNGQTSSGRVLRTGDGSRYSRCRFRVLQKPIFGTTDGECGHCLGVRSFLLEILQAFMTVTLGQFQGSFEPYGPNEGLRSTDDDLAKAASAVLDKEAQPLIPSLDRKRS